MSTEGSNIRDPLSSQSVQGIRDPNVSFHTMNTSPDRSLSKSLTERLWQSTLYDHDDSTLASEPDENEHTSAADRKILDAVSVEERRLLQSFAMSNQQLQRQYDTTGGEEISDAENLQKIQLWSTLLECLNDLYKLWSTTTSHLFSGNRTPHGKQAVQDVDIETFMSYLLSMWKLSIDELDPNLKIPLFLSTIKIATMAAKQPDVKSILFRCHLKKLALIIPPTVSLLLTASTNTPTLLKPTEDYTEMNEEKKSDECHGAEARRMTIENSQTTSDQVLPLLLQFIREITMKRQSKLTPGYDDFISHTYPAILQYSCYSNPLFMIDISAILWKWSVTSAHCLLRSSSVWESIEFMWIYNYENEAHRGSDVRENDPDSRVLSNLAAVVGTMITFASQDDTIMNSVPPKGAHDLEMIQKQEWLVRYLIDEVGGKRVHSRVDCRRRCMRTIRCLMATSWGRIVFWNQISKEDFVAVVLQVMRSLEEDVDTRTLACQTLGLLVRERIIDVHLGPYIETTLLEIIEGDPEVDDDSHIRDISRCDVLVLSACHVLTMCLEFSPWSRSLDCFTEPMFEHLLHVLQSNVDLPNYHSTISELFAALAVKQENVEDHHEISSTRIKGICAVLSSYPSVLETFAILLSPTASKPEFDKVRESTIKILSGLIESDSIEKTNQQLMAADEHLLTALVNVCLMNNNESPLKDEAKRIILTLIPEL